MWQNLAHNRNSRVVNSNCNSKAKWGRERCLFEKDNEGLKGLKHGWFWSYLCGLDKRKNTLEFAAKIGQCNARNKQIPLHSPASPFSASKQRRRQKRHLGLPSMTSSKFWNIDHRQSHIAGVNWWQYIGQRERRMRCGVEIVFWENSARYEKEEEAWCTEIG